MAPVFDAAELGGVPAFDAAELGGGFAAGFAAGAFAADELLEDFDENANTLFNLSANDCSACVCCSWPMTSA